VDDAAFPGLISYDVHDFFVDRPRCCVDHVAVQQINLCCRIWVCERINRALGILLALMIPLWASAFWWKSALLIADAIAGSHSLESGTLSSLVIPSRLFPMLNPAVGAGPGPWPMGALRLFVRGGSAPHHLVGVGADCGLGAGCGLDCSVSCRLGFRCCHSC
jgi:hypothetical protein